MMDFTDPKVLIGGALAGGAVLYFLLRSPAAPADDGYAPSLISYVSPGDRDAVVTGSGTTNTTTTANDSIADALKASNLSSNDTNLSVLNTDSLLTNISGLVKSQVSKLPFKTDYGFTSNITGGIQLDKAGAPQFSFTSRFTPQDPSNFRVQNRRLNANVTNLRTKLKNTRDQLAKSNARNVGRP